MKQIEAQQGSQAWHIARAAHFCASEAPAMLGVSKFMTRSELLAQKKTGITPDVDVAKQRIFDAGHQAEADARPIAEGIIGQDLYPMVATRKVDGLPLLASFDGITMDESIVWETKLWNESLAQTCAAGDLEPHYWAQLEHQLIVSGAEKVLFTTSDGTPEHTVQCWYKSVPERREQVLKGWTQFAADLENYVPEVTAPKPIGRTPDNLPALHIEVTGMVTASNLAEYKAHALAVFAGINRELVTDSDFANAESTVKWCSDIEQRLAAAKQHALSQTATIDDLFRTINDISAEARATRLELDKLVKSRKDTIRLEIVDSGRTAINEHITALNTRIGRKLMPGIPVDFAGAIKGKRSIDSLRDAVATELARAKIEANAVADKITLNLRAINDQADFGFLFSDVETLVLKDPELVAVGIKYRIADHQAKEAARLEAQRLQIEATERAKAEAAARARADAEIAAAARKAADERATEQARQYEELERAEIKRLADLNAALIVAAPASVVQAAVEMRDATAGEIIVLTGDKVTVPTAKPDAGATMRLGQICERLGFNLTADFLASLGFEQVAIEKNAKLYREDDFTAICQALIQHITDVCQAVAA